MPLATLIEYKGFTALVLSKVPIERCDTNVLQGWSVENTMNYIKRGS